MQIQAAAIIPAAGSGSRMKLGHPKQFHELGGAPILIHTVRVFFQCPAISQIVVAAPAEMLSATEKTLADHGLMGEKVKVVVGGIRRQDSVFHALEILDDSIEMVLVHDGARPLIQQGLIEQCISAAMEHGAAIAAVPVKDTLKKGADNKLIEATIDRDRLWQAQTPQVARLSLLKEAYAHNKDADVTDEASLLEKAGIPVYLVEGAETNIKVTRPEDLHIAERLLNTSMIKIGHGFDAHRFSEDRKLVLGGVTVPHSHGLAGHSDADVVTHAICDALLGALGLGDIGKHFPDTSDAYKDIYSITLLEKVAEEMSARGYSISNLDVTIVCQRPKLAPHIEDMRQIIAKAAQAEQNQVNIKATTTEKMGFTGREEGISCHAVALIQQQ